MYRATIPEGLARLPPSPRSWPALGAERPTLAPGLSPPDSAGDVAGDVGGDRDGGRELGVQDQDDPELSALFDDTDGQFRGLRSVGGVAD